MTPKSHRTTHPIVFLVLCVPFGAAIGYVHVSLGYLLSHAGVSVVSIAGIVALSGLPQTWKILWAPIVDTTLSSKRWYLLGAIASAATMAALGFITPARTTLTAIFVLVFINSVAITVVAMAAESLMAYSTDHGEKGRAGGWYQAGNLGGVGIGGGAALWISQRTTLAWLPATAIAGLILACSLALVFIVKPDSSHRRLRYLARVRDLVSDVVGTAKSRAGLLALLICFLPIGSGAAASLWSAVAGEWRANADTVAIVNGVAGGIVAAVGCIIGGYLCDRIDRKVAYALFGVLIAACALVMAVSARSRSMFIAFTLLYAFMQGLNFAAFSAVVLEAIGRGAAATKYNLYASLSNIPIAYMTIVNGWAYGRWQGNGLLAADSLAGLGGVALFAAVFAATRLRKS